MSTLLDQFTADLAAILPDATEATTFVPGEQGDSGTGFTFPAALGVDSTDVAVLEGGESASDRRLIAFGSLAVLQAGLLAALGTVRDPHRGDRLRVASGAQAGLWQVTSASGDVGGGCTLKCRLERATALGGPGARESRP